MDQFLADHPEALVVVISVLLVIVVGAFHVLEWRADRRQERYWVARRAERTRQTSPTSTARPGRAAPRRTTSSQAAHSSDAGTTASLGDGDFGGGGCDGGGGGC